MNMKERARGVSCVRLSSVQLSRLQLARRQPWLSATFVLLLGACGASDRGEETWDENAPTVVDTVPAAGDMAVDSSLSEVTVTFSEAMEVSGWSWVTEDGHAVPNVNGIPFYADVFTAVLPVYLKPDTHYALWVNSPDDESLRKFASADGITARAYRINFHTR
jgi:hypothetical protein